MKKEDFLKTIPKLEAVWILQSVYTRAPYVECDEVTADDQAYFFTEEPDAVLCENRKNAEVEVCHAVKTEKKDLLKTFISLIELGINAVVFNASGEEFRFQLTDIVRKPDTSNLPKEKRPLSNPTLSLSMLYYAQEARKPKEMRNAERIKELDEEMVVNMLRANYLIPTRRAEIDGKPVQQFTMVKTPAGTALIPIFTDGIEYAKLPAQEGTVPAVTNFSLIAKLPMNQGLAGFVINPFGVNMPLSPEFMKNALNTYTWK